MPVQTLLPLALLVFIRNHRLTFAIASDEYLQKRGLKYLTKLLGQVH